MAHKCRVDKHDRELNDPEDEEGKEVLGGDAGASGESVGNVLPAVAEDAAQGNRGEHAAVKCLCCEVDDGY